MTAIAPQLERLIEINGASYLSFYGLTFEHSSYNPQNGSMIGIQASYIYKYDKRFIPSAIHILDSHHTTFANCTFRNMGGGAVEFEKGTHDNLIEKSRFYQISANGITLRGDDDTLNAASFCKNETIRNNLIFKVAQDYTGCIGIFCAYPIGVKIENNEISDLPYTGINIGWGWPGWKGTEIKSALENNLIRGNEIHDVMLLHNDGAGIYVLRKQPGTIIEENYIHDIRESDLMKNAQIRYPIAGIYLDELSNNITVLNNVIENVSKPIHQHLLFPSSIDKNIWISESGQEARIKDMCGPY
jgi:hypothetical protein